MMQEMHPQTEDVEGKALLLEDASDDDPDSESRTTRVSDRGSKNSTYFLAAHFILLSLNLFVLFLNIAASRSSDTAPIMSPLGQKTQSPADAAIRYTITQMDFDPDSSDFVGEPSASKDHAWSKLLRSSMIKISEEELRDLNKTSIALRDGSGYIAYLETLHMLHCVKNLYQLVHKEHYADLVESKEFNNGHWDHCLEILRQGIMCNAEATIITYEWDDHGGIEAHRSGSRSCTDWKTIEDWADKRMVKIGQPDAFLATLVPKIVL